MKLKVMKLIMNGEISLRHSKSRVIAYHKKLKTYPGVQSTFINKLRFKI